jgi:site-specific recombinase XerD
MSIKPVKGGWQVDIKPGGRSGRRTRKTFKKKAEALEWETWVKSQNQQSPGWAPPKKDPRRLTEIIELWHRHHGVSLRSGEDTKRRLLAIAETVGNPIAESFTADTFAQYRTKRLADGVTASNLNRELQYFKAVFNELKRLDYWNKDNPLEKVRAFKIPERELSFLTNEQIRSLLEALPLGRNRHVTLIAKICLATGARWSEAEELRIGQLRGGKIQYARTKSGKTRAVPIGSSLEEEIRAHHHQYGRDERIFDTAWSAFREGIERSKVDLPDGQMTHVLRHTFASHFMMNGGNILALQKILGHASLTMTMRYAHLAPEHLQEAIALNPLNNLQSQAHELGRQ